MGILLARSNFFNSSAVKANSSINSFVRLTPLAIIDTPFKAGCQSCGNQADNFLGFSSLVNNYPLCIYHKQNIVYSVNILQIPNNSQVPRRGIAYCIVAILHFTVRFIIQFNSIIVKKYTGRTPKGNPMLFYIFSVFL